MKLIATTVIRAAQMGGIHGGLYVIDTEKSDILHYHPYSDEFSDYNERGGERGLRGIAVLPDKIIVASSNSLIELDKENYAIKQEKTSEFFKSIHEICYHEDDLWVVCWADVVSDESVKNVWELSGDFFDDYQKITTKSLISNTEGLSDKNHINSISSLAGRLVFSSALSDLYDFETLEIVCPRTMGGFTHNFYEYKDCVLSNKTTLRKLKVTTEKGDVAFSIPSKSGAKDGLDGLAEDNWNRGLCKKDNLVFLGSSPARILQFNLNNFKFEKEIIIENDIRHCVHGLEAIGV